ncbi:MAG TPA: DivIVA domain-containing protein [Feifaniaceae bacterium]|nr:DivIVA domain-containing protein [Feifaniaceae bacterium]
MKRREMKQLLEERIERITLLENRIDTMEQLIEGYRTREQSIIDTLRAAQETASRIASKAETSASGVLDEANRRAQEVAEQAARAAEEQLSNAKAESERMTREADLIKREYEELMTSFNAMLEQNASELQQTAARFASFVRSHRVEVPEGETFYKNVVALASEELPDPSGDPSRLMQNIYRIQNRPLPQKGETPEEAAREGEAPQQSEVSRQSEAPQQSEAPEPYSSQAWASEQHTSPSEPQAEFSEMFDEAFHPEEQSVSPVAAPLPPRPAERRLTKEESQAEMQRAFNQLFTKNDSDYTPELAQNEVSPEDAQGPEGAAPAPFSSDAWASESHQSPTEPQAEFTPAFDAAFAKTDYIVSPDSDCEPPKAPDAPASKEPQEPESAPEPYSSGAWATESHTSPTEPQAEAERVFDAMFPAEGDAPAGVFERAAEEPREWEPEREPEMGEAPSVAELIPEKNDDGDDVSLDDLLDEIIKAGE